MNKILILFTHPRFEQSRSNDVLVRSIPENEHITFHDLYEEYADFNIDIEREKQLLLDHDIIIWHHPFYWYSAPSLLKQWIDMVLEFGWAYGLNGTALKDKVIFNVLTSGGPRKVYQHDSPHRHTVREFLAPFEQTCLLCQMIYLPPFAVQGTHKLSSEDLQQAGSYYRELLERLIKNDYNLEQLAQYEYLNDWITKNQTAS